MIIHFPPALQFKCRHTEQRKEPDGTVVEIFGGSSETEGRSKQKGGASDHPNVDQFIGSNTVKW